MPRRRSPRKEISAEEISLRLANALTPKKAITSERDAHERRKPERARDLARDRLMQVYRSAEERGQTDQLNFQVRLVCELLKDRNEDKPTGGRPIKEGRRLLIAGDMLEAIERHGVEERGSVEAAFKDVALRHSTTYRYVRNIYYSSDRKWRRDVLLDLAMRDPDPERRYANLKRWAWQRKKGDKG
jgi:hypothetical protein